MLKPWQAGLIPWVVMCATVPAFFLVPMKGYPDYIYWIVYAFYGASPLWAVFESRRLNFKNFRTICPSNPYVIGIGCLFLWAYLFPIFMYARQDVINKTAQPADATSSIKANGRQFAVLTTFWTTFVFGAFILFSGMLLTFIVNFGS